MSGLGHLLGLNIYVIGSLRNPRVPDVANALRAYGHDAFDDWYAAGRNADSEWRRYEQGRGRTYKEALSGLAAGHVFRFDFEHMLMSDCAVLVSPAGRSGYLELGYMLGKGRPGFILLEGEPDRWDVMALFATGVARSIEELVEFLS